MGISSLGVGSSILTQDVLDQLRAADEAGQIVPIDLSIANEGDKEDAIKLIEATMENFTDSVNALKSSLLYDERVAEVVGSSVEVTALSNTDVQDFTLNVTTLATKQIEESGAFSSKTDLIAADDGSINLNIDGEDFTIAYDATTTLVDLKNLINEEAGDKVDATIVQINSGEFRLFISSAETGTTQNITISDNTGNLLASDGTTTGDDRLTDGMTVIQPGVDAEFTFNGQDITRTSNKIDDLITGLTITIKETGTSSVSVAQDRDNIMDKFSNFVDKYNSAITELDKMIKPSTESDERGIFSSESTIKNMKRAIQDMISNVGGGVGAMFDYGFDVDKDGKMTLDQDILNSKLDDNPSGVEIFFVGGDFDNGDGTTTTVDGAFTEMSVITESYTKYNAILDLFKESITDKISSLEDKKTIVTERLDAKYEILKKQYAAYDLVISRLNAASSMFTQMTEAATDN